MPALRRSMSSVNAWLLAMLICGVLASSLYALLSYTYRGEDLAASYKEPIEEAFVVSGDFMGVAPQHEAQASSPIGVQWSYSGSGSPANWGGLRESYQTCEKGKQQSPIDIVRPTLSSKLLPLRFFYREAEVAVVKEHHGLNVPYESGSYVEFDGMRYDLISLDFHSPSEHLIDGIPYEMEVHLFHQNSQGQEIIIAIFMEEGGQHEALASLWQHLPERLGGQGETVAFNAATLLPKLRTYYSYRGSRTTPPCEEGVQWIVMTRPVAMASSQVDRFLKVVRYNARPVQPLRGRSILRSRR